MPSSNCKVARDVSRLLRRLYVRLDRWEWAQRKALHVREMAPVKGQSFVTKHPGLLEYEAF